MIQATGSAGMAAAVDGSGGWMAVTGAVLVGLALLLLVVPAIAAWTPRSTALRGGLRESAGRTVRSVAASAEGLAGSVLARTESASSLDRRLDQAGLDVRPGEFLVGVSVAAFAAFVLFTALVSWLVGLLAAATAVLAARALLVHLASERRRKFASQLSETLRMLAGSLRAGYGLSQAVDVVQREAEAPTSEEFRRFTVEMRLGRDFGEALQAMAARVRSQDFDWVVQAFEIHRDVGGDLAEILDSVNDTIRDRDRIRRKVRALSAEGRLSAVVLVSLPFVFAGISFALNRKYLSELTASGAGIAMIVGGATLLLMGALWLRRLVRLTY